MIDLSKLFGGGNQGQFGDWSPAPGAGSPGGGGFGSGDVLGLGGAAAALAGGITGAVGAEQAGKAQARGFEENALTAGINAGITRGNLARQQLQADYKLNRLTGAQRAGYGAANVTAASGTPLDVMGDTAEQAKIEAMSRFYAGDSAAMSADQQSTYDREAAAAARKAGDTSAFGDILGGIGSAAKLAATVFAL